GRLDRRERGEVRRRAAGRTWADARAEVGISPRTSTRVTGLRGGCPIKISVLLKLVCPIRLAGGCRTPRDCSPSQCGMAALAVRQSLSDCGRHNENTAHRLSGRRHGPGGTVDMRRKQKNKTSRRTKRMRRQLGVGENNLNDE